MNSTPKTPESQLKATKKYLSKFVDIKIRVSPVDRDTIQTHAAEMNESTTAFIKRAVRETIGRDKRSS